MEWMVAMVIRKKWDCLFLVIRHSTYVHTMDLHIHDKNADNPPKVGSLLLLLEVATEVDLGVPVNPCSFFSTLGRAECRAKVVHKAQRKMSCCFSHPIKATELWSEDINFAVFLVCGLPEVYTYTLGFSWIFLRCSWLLCFALLGCQKGSTSCLSCAYDGEVRPVENLM